MGPRRRRGAGGHEMLGGSVTELSPGVSSGLPESVQGQMGSGQGGVPILLCQLWNLPGGGI